MAAAATKLYVPDSDGCQRAEFRQRVHQSSDVNAAAAGGQVRPVSCSRHVVFLPIGDRLSLPCRTLVTGAGLAPDFGAVDSD